MSVVPPVSSRPCACRENTLSSRRRIAACCGSGGGGRGGVWLGLAGAGIARSGGLLPRPSGRDAPGLPAAGIKQPRRHAQAQQPPAAASAAAMPALRSAALQAAAGCGALTSAASRLGCCPTATLSTSSSSSHTSSDTWCLWWPSATCGHAGGQSRRVGKQGRGRHAGRPVGTTRRRGSDCAAGSRRVCSACRAPRSPPTQTRCRR